MSRANKERKAANRARRRVDPVEFAPPTHFKDTSPGLPSDHSWGGVVDLAAYARRDQESKPEAAPDPDMLMRWAYATGTTRSMKEAACSECGEVLGRFIDDGRWMGAKVRWAQNLVFVHIMEEHHAAIMADHLERSEA